MGKYKSAAIFLSPSFEANEQPIALIPDFSFFWPCPH
jgi:hypothetical protein